MSVPVPSPDVLLAQIAEFKAAVEAAHHPDDIPSVVLSPEMERAYSAAAEFEPGDPRRIAGVEVHVNWAWEWSYAHDFFSDWWRFYRRALPQAITRATFWPRSGWFYDDGMITWSWDARAEQWRDFGGRVCLRKH